jgi:hypothetical protein
MNCRHEIPESVTAVLVLVLARAPRARAHARLPAPRRHLQVAQRRRMDSPGGMELPHARGAS